MKLVKTCRPNLPGFQNLEAFCQAQIMGRPRPGKTRQRPLDAAIFRILILDDFELPAASYFGTLPFPAHRNPGRVAANITAATALFSGDGGKLMHPLTPNAGPAGRYLCRRIVIGKPRSSRFRWFSFSAETRAAI